MIKRGILCLSILLTALFSTGCSSQEDVCEDSSDIPSSGLIQITSIVDESHSEFIGSVLRVQDRVDTLIECDEVEFKSSVIVEDTFPYATKFKKVTDVPNNRHTMYRNDEYFLFYIETEQGGTWLVGETPGIDRGHAYCVVKDTRSSPIGLSSWFWLHDARWKSYPDMRVECSSGAVAGTLYTISLINNMGGIEEGILRFSSVDNLYTLHLDKISVEVNGIKNLHEMGEAVLLPAPEGTTNTEEAILSVIEASTSRMWQLIFNLKKGGERKALLPKRIGDEGIPSPMPAPSDVGRFLSGTGLGEYIWAFYEGRTLPFKDNHDAIAIHQVLLLAVAPGVFRVFPSDRDGAMSQPMLSQDVDLLVLNGSNLQHPDGSKLQVISCRNLGRADRVLQGIQNHLLALEKKHHPAFGTFSTTSVTHVPGCFLYHSSLSLPSPLVYAAEIVCLLMGAKPVVMIQYATPSEHQWKFPLVQELVRAIAATVLSSGIKDYSDDDSPPELGMRIFSYRNDKSLILFRENRKYLVDALIPGNASQALHPTPYPDEQGPMVQEEYRLQVYNSFWNGFVLGYPLQFINRYCEDFHNPLTPERKRLIADEAYADVSAYFLRNSLEAIQIGLELDKPLSNTTMESIYGSVSA